MKTPCGTTNVWTLTGSPAIDDAADHESDADSAVIYSMSYVETVDDVATFIADIYYDGTGIWTPASTPNASSC